MGHEIGVFEHVSPDVYAMHCRLDPEPDEQEPQQFPVVLQERVAGHDPDAGTGMKLAGHVIIATPAELEKILHRPWRMTHGAPPSKSQITVWPLS